MGKIRRYIAPFEDSQAGKMTVREIGLGWRKIFDEGEVDKIIFEFKVKSNKLC